MGGDGLDLLFRLKANQLPLATLLGIACNRAAAGRLVQLARWLSLATQRPRSSAPGQTLDKVVRFPVTGQSCDGGRETSQVSKAGGIVLTPGLPVLSLRVMRILSAYFYYAIRKSQRGGDPLAF